MSHNHAIGFLGSVAAAVFTAYAIRMVPLKLWGKKFLDEIIPIADAYVKETKRSYEEYQPGWQYFVKAWTDYLELRKLTDGGDPDFPKEYGVPQRDQFYRSISLNGWGGANGHDSPIIA